MEHSSPGVTAHAASLAGLDLVEMAPPLLRVESAREVVVVLPRSRTPERELHLAACRADAVPIVVRPSGGGAVVLAPGVVTASLLTAMPPGGIFPEPHFRRYCGAVAAALVRAGVPEVRIRGVSDLTIGNRKIAGSALRMWRGRSLFQLSLLVDMDLDLMERYLAMPSREPAYREKRSHQDFVTTLKLAGLAITCLQAEAILGRALEPFLR